MSSDTIIPIFSTQASLNASILTCENQVEIKDNAPVSVVAIAKKHNLKHLYIADSSISLFIQCYENFSALKIPFTWGLKLNVCNDVNDKSEQSLKTESKVIIWMNNSAAYKDIVKLYTKSHTKDFYYRGRTDWKTIQDLWTDNLSLSIPFYGGFMHTNFFYGHSSLVDFGQIKPSFLINKMGLPFDDILEKRVKFYALDNQYEIVESHPIYYYKEEDFDAYTVFRCIGDRKKFESPNIDNYCSNKFSFESYLKRIGKNINE